MKIVSIVGARPQFIKCAPVSRILRSKFQEILVHTGQHYDEDMSDVFFRELHIPAPDYNLNIGSETHGKQTGLMLSAIESVLQKEKPDVVLVYGDTNSTIAGGLAAAKMHIPVAHIEAGLRSYDRSMPEEINRVLVDHISDLLFCPTETAVQNLLKEGIIKGVYNVGDVMVDALLCNKEIASRKSDILTRFGLTDKNFILATIHRPSNTDNAAHMKMIIQAFGESGQTILFPIHPRTRKYLKEYGYLGQLPKNIIAADPLGYIDMLHAMAKCQKVITDSGGVQKEAYILGKPCITVRENTEWIETLEGGWNILTGPDKNKILDAIERKYPVCTRRALFGEGDAAIKITDIIEKFMK